MKPTVLVVDDEPRILDSICDLLEDDFAVLIATDAEAALRLLKAEKIAVILSDQRMPGMTGNQLLAKAKEISEATRILITGYTDINALIQAVNYGQIYTYITKPWDPMHLKLTVTKAAEHSCLATQLISERNLLHALMDNIPDSIWFKDVAGRFTRVNKAMESFLGGSAPDLVNGKTAFDLLPPAVAQGVTADDESTLKSMRPTTSNRRFDWPESRSRWMSTTTAPIPGEDGAVAGLVGISRDITEQVLLEEQFRRSQKLEAVGRLAGGMAHDFNNALTVISGYCALLLSQMEAGDSRRRRVEAIQKAARQAAKITQQLLTFSRKRAVQLEILDLNAAVASLQEMAQPLIGEDIELDVRLAPALGQIRADAGQIDQVLMNLIVNSRDAMVRGGRLTVETANVELDAKSRQVPLELAPGPYVMLGVSDTGCGMDSDTLGHIFEPFFTTKEVGRGTGLGLSVVHGIVSQAGGSIHVSSEPGQGTAVTIYFPRVSQETNHARFWKLPGERLSGSETILVVEDLNELRELIRETLEPNGYEVLLAGDGLAALEICERIEKPLDLIVTDVRMPRMGGQELAQALKKRQPELKVLYMSGYNDDTSPGGTVSEGSALLLPKPFTPEALLRKVREVLDAPHAVESRS